MKPVRRSRRALVVASALASWVLFATFAAPVGALPLDDVAPHRDAEGRHLETVAVGLPDATLPTFESRCHSARGRAEARARVALERHVERAVERAGGTPPVIARARQAVGASLEIVERRPLVDCGIVVRARVPIAALAAAAPGLEVAW